MIDPQRFRDSTGRGVRIAVIDSGVDIAHEAIRDARVSTSGVVMSNRRLAIEPEEPSDAFGHGTAVASIIHALAPDARIDSIRVFGGDVRTSSDRVLFALQHAVAERYDVVNCSFGSRETKLLPRYKEVVDAAFCANVLIVAAANNYDPERLEYPAAFASVLSTAFATSDDPLHLERRIGTLIEFAARGGNLRVAWKDGGYVVSSGSSFATPHLSAMAARIRELQPAWNACEVKSALYSMAVNQPA